MPEWEIDPFSPDNFPQTPEVYLGQIQEEIDSAYERIQYLQEERYRVRMEMERLENEREGS